MVLNNLEYTLMLVLGCFWHESKTLSRGTVLTLDAFNKHVYCLERLSIILLRGAKSSYLRSEIKNLLSHNFLLSFWEHAESSRGFSQNEGSRIYERK